MRKAQEFVLSSYIIYIIFLQAGIERFASPLTNQKHSKQKYLEIHQMKQNYKVATPVPQNGPSQGCDGESYVCAVTMLMSRY